jgi:hypothetical protein
LSYTVNDKEYDYWSAKNQQIVDNLVNREVYCCMTSEVEYMLSKTQNDPDDDNPFSEDDYNKTISPCCSKCDSSYGFEELTVAEAKDCCEEDKTLYRCQDCGKIYSEDEYERLNYKQQEIYEWWAVSIWFGKKLAEKGCAVIESYGKSYWGRCTTGQSISLDGCIVSIAKDMKILDGMENVWSD